MFFGISAQNDAEWWSYCRQVIDFRITYEALNVGYTFGYTLAHHSFEPHFFRVTMYIGYCLYDFFGTYITEQPFCFLG